MRNVRLARVFSTVAGVIAALAFLFVSAMLILDVSSGFRSPFTTAWFSIDASFPVVIASYAVALVVFAYTHFPGSQLCRPCRSGCNLGGPRLGRRRLQRRSAARSALLTGSVRGPLIALLLTAAAKPEAAYIIATKANLLRRTSKIQHKAGVRARPCGPRTGKLPGGTVHFERLYERFPCSAAARYGLGDLLLWKRVEPEKASRLLAAALKDSDRSSLPHWNRLGFEAELRASYASSLATLGLAEDFQYTFDEALRLAGQKKPIRAAVCLRLGNALEALRRANAARKYWAAAHDVDPHGWAGNQAMQNLSTVLERS